MDNTTYPNISSKARRTLVDLETGPRPFENWKVKVHRKGGLVDFNTAKIRLFVHDRQLSGGITGKELLKKIDRVNAFNVNVLDYLLDNPSLIPDKWKVNARGEPCYIFFWGTVYYRPQDHGLYVRCLHFSSGRWLGGYRSIDYPWPANSLAAICKD
jgi:hypothetical protein